MSEQVTGGNQTFTRIGPAPVAKYQPFDPLRPEELTSLEADIVKRGVLIPVEKDEEGNILDGHHRTAIAKKHNLPCPEVVRKFATEAEKHEHAVKLNLLRRHCDALRWGLHFKHYLATKGVKRGRGAVNQHTVASATVAEATKEFGVPERTAERRLALADRYDELPAKLRKAVDTGELTVTRAVREHSQAQRKATLATLPDDKFRVWYADPPWKYGNDGLGITQYGETYGPAERHYPAMSIDELCALGDDIQEHAHDDAVLFLWVTSPLLEDCFKVIKAWGFTYKSSFIWDKVKHNFGHYNSVRHELLLVCTRGSCTPEIKELYDSVVSIERAEHSVKPQEFRKMIEALYPTGKRIEMFARSKHEGWEAYGNEVTRIADVIDLRRKAGGDSHLGGAA